MKVVILQSNYIPWKGYFDLIHDADIFVFYDEVQFTKNDWRNRNKLYTKNGIQWLSIPIAKDAVKKNISAVELTDPHWQVQHLKSIKLGYRGAEFFHQLEPILDFLYLENHWTNLSELNQEATKYIASYLGITTQFINSKDLILEGDRVEKLINMLKQLNATEYISGPAAINYISNAVDLFSSNNIKLTFKDYSNYPVYKQFNNTFENAVSILDLLAHVEKSKITNYIWKWRSQ